MRHLAWAGVAVGVAFATAASCVPDFEFRPEGAGAGAGGSAAGTGGGGTGGAGGQGGAVTSGSSAGGGGAGTGGAGGGGGEGGGGPVVPAVACIDGTDCAPGAFCCYHEVYAFCDVCSEEGQCKAPDSFCGGASDYRLRRCNGPEDCQPGQECCEEATGDTACFQACGAGQTVVCTVAAQCPSTAPNCVPDQPSYPGYNNCAP